MTRARARWVASTALFTMVLSGCGGSPPDPERPEAALPTPPDAWTAMAHADRRAWMVSEVLPRMSELFAEYDGARYAGFGCASCHGRDARAHGFAMPSPALPALFPTGTPEQHQMVRDYPDGVRFMFNRVLPTMQTLLGAPDFDAATGEGFSCYACHPHAGDEGSTPIRLQLAADEAPSP